MSCVVSSRRLTTRKINPHEAAPLVYKLPVEEIREEGEYNMRTSKLVLPVILAGITLIGMSTPASSAADSTSVDHSTVASASAHLEHLSELFAFKGRPLNLDPDRPVTVLINHGYMVGFSAARKQPVWAAYRVSDAKQGTNYERPHFFYDDLRLPKSARIGTDTFGEGFDRGHLVPNSAINRQYGKLAQMETFFMSNISPQKAGLNRGVWMRLEQAIVEDFAPAWGHIWVITGPIFADQPATLAKLEAHGVSVPIPSDFFIILVDVHGPMGRSIDVLCFRFPQDTPRGAQLTTTFIKSIDDLEAATKLNFFPYLSPSQQITHESKKAPEIWSVEVDE